MEEIIAIGNKIDMEILEDGHPVENRERRRVLSCRIMDLPEQNIARISMPFHEGRLVPLAVGDQYIMNIFAQKGIFASRFIVVNRMKEGNLFLADMEIQEPLKKVQRREYFRHECRIAADYRIVTAEEVRSWTPQEGEEPEWKRGVLLDISGGGVRMVSEYKEEANQYIQLRFLIRLDGENHRILQYGKLIASIRKENNAVLYEQRVEFEGIGDREREVLIRYIFDAERKKISKEKGTN